MSAAVSALLLAGAIVFPRPGIAAGTRAIGLPVARDALALGELRDRAPADKSATRAPGASGSVPVAGTNTAQARMPVPGYIEADRSSAEQALGPALADEVFSDKFTPLRKQLVSASLRANPASGCARPPDFILAVVAPVEASAWQERYLIKCKADVRRTFLLVSTKDGVKSAELAPGDTIADATLQRDVLQGVMAATIGRAPANCKDVQVRDTRVTSATAMAQPWTEVWTLGACGTAIDVEIDFTPSPRGGTDWSIHLGK